jgi:hypothetical protein
VESRRAHRSPLRPRAGVSRGREARQADGGRARPGIRATSPACW